MLVPQAADMPTVTYLDKNNRSLPDDAPAEQVAFSVYEIHLHPGQRYQPHPAFARDAQGKPEYLALKSGDLNGIYNLPDFPHSGLLAHRATSSMPTGSSLRKVGEDNKQLTATPSQQEIAHSGGQTTHNTSYPSVYRK